MLLLCLFLYIHVFIFNFLTQEFKCWKAWEWNRFSQRSPVCQKWWPLLATSSVNILSMLLGWWGDSFKKKNSCINIFFWCWLSKHNNYVLISLSKLNNYVFPRVWRRTIWNMHTVTHAHMHARMHACAFAHTHMHECMHAHTHIAPNALNLLMRLNFI